MQNQMTSDLFIGMFILTVRADVLEVIQNPRMQIECVFVCTPMYTFLLM